MLRLAQPATNPLVPLNRPRSDASGNFGALLRLKPRVDVFAAAFRIRIRIRSGGLLNRKRIGVCAAAIAAALKNADRAARPLHFRRPT